MRVLREELVGQKHGPSAPFSCLWKLYSWLVPRKALQMSIVNLSTLGEFFWHVLM